MNLRHATKSDIAQIASLHARSWQDAYRGIYSDHYLDHDVVEDRLAVWQERLSSEDASRVVILAERDTGIEGFICAFGDDDPQWGSLIDNLHVAPDSRRTGLGTALMLECAGWLREHYPQSGVYLWALEANSRARSFYHRLGGRHAETVPQPTPDGGSALSCRYVWPSPADLEERCQPR